MTIFEIAVILLLLGAVIKDWEESRTTPWGKLGFLFSMIVAFVLYLIF